MTEDHGPASPSQDVSLRPSKAHVARHKTLTSFMVKEMDKPRTDAQDYVVSQRYTKRWSPFWLRRTTLIGFIAAYVVLAGALLALWLADRSGNGFSIGNSPQYAWTYGPTAVLVVIISFWRRVDYQCKLLQPWIALHKGPASAERSVLLDYVSPIQFTSLARAIRHRHYVVVASIIGFALLKLIVLFSTGLLVLSPTEMDGVFPAVLGTNFNGSDFWPSIQYPGIQNGYSGQSLFYVPAYSNVGGASVQAFLGTLSGMATPENIVGNNTFQSFELTENTAAQEISAKVDVFEPRSSCEIAQPNITSKYIDILNVTLRSKTCSVGFGEQETITPDFMGGSNCSSKACIVPVPLYSMMRVNCSNLETGSSGITYLGPNVTDDLRFALLAGTVTSKRAKQYSRRQVQATSQSYPVDVDINLSTAAICKIDYALESSTVHHDWKTDSFTIGSSTQDRRLEELTGVMLGEIMFAALAEADNLLLDFAVPPTSSLFSVMLQTLSGEQSLQRLLDAETLQRAATFSLAGIATHFMQQSYLLHSNITSAASVTYVEQRLHVGMTSMILMVVGFFLLVLCTMCVDLIQRKVLLPRNPDSIATSLMVLRTSDNFRSLLREAGRLRTSRLIALLRDYRFKIKIGATLQIESILAEVATEKTAPKTKQYAWMPFAATHTAVGLMLITPTAALLALEVLARLSEAEHGIVDVSTQELTAAVSSRYITALIMLLIATCFGSFDFVVSSFAPFSLLRKGTVPASRVAFSALVGSMPPIALVQSLRMRHYASMLSNMAAMTGGVLTIVASGLFFVDHNVYIQHPSVAHYTDSWNVTWDNSSLSGDSGADTVLDHVQHEMMIMPSSIWHDVVLPEVDGIRGLSHSASNSPTSRNYTIQLDALRPVLDCQVVPDERMKISGTKYPDTFRIYASPKLPTSCQRGGQNGTDDHVNYQLGFQTDQLWAGQLLDLHLGPWPEDVKSQVTLDLASQGEWLSGNYSTMPDNPAGCPSIGLIFAKVSANKTSLDDITALLCSQKIQLVKVKVTYKGDLSAKAIINPDIPPVLLDNPVKYITNGTPGFESFPWRVQTYLSANIGKNLTAFNVDGEMQHDDGSSSTESSVDIFFNNVIYGPNGTAPEDLAGVENRGNLIKAVQTLYNRYMSIVIDVKFRQPISQAAIGDQSNTVNGTMQIQTSRLKVNNASKLALQIMLGVMTLLGLGAYWLTDLRGTLPRNPCSIASSMGFLAGSELCDGSNALIPEDAIEMSEEEQKSLFDGVLLSLGWWADRKDESRGMLDGSHEGSTQSLLDDGDVPRDRIFGVDVGTPEQLGFRETRWWKLRRRMARSDA